MGSLGISIYVCSIGMYRVYIGFRDMTLESNDGYRVWLSADQSSGCWLLGKEVFRVLGFRVLGFRV